MIGFFDKLKNSKGSMFLILGLAAGIILLFIGSGDSAKRKEAAIDTSPDEAEEALDYISELERRVAELLGYMDGISDVHVIITPENAGETVYAQNGSYDGGVMTEREYVITDVDGNGTPIKVKLVFPKLRGIAVVCRGGGNPINQEKIVSLLSALFDLSSNRVYVTG